MRKSDAQEWLGASSRGCFRHQPKLHQQRLLQLPDTFVMRRMTDEICRNHRVRPKTIAEINTIETLLRSFQFVPVDIEASNLLGSATVRACYEMHGALPPGLQRMVLIDTTGMGHRDNRVAEQINLLDNPSIRRVLLLNAAAQTGLAAYKSFSFEDAIDRKSVV